MRPRRQNTLPLSPTSRSGPQAGSSSRRHTSHWDSDDDGGAEGGDEAEDAPLLGGGQVTPPNVFSGKKPKRSRPSTAESTAPSRRPQLSVPASREYANVNFPPSVPGSPKPARLGMLSPNDINIGGSVGDAIIDIPHDAAGDHGFIDSTICRTPPGEFPGLRLSGAEADVCFPVDDGLSDDEATAFRGASTRARRMRVREWPDLSVLEDWSREEKEERSEGIRAKKTAEPVYVGGRLRAPRKSGWHREVEDEPYRFTYFNDELPATIHSHTISELLQPGQMFKDLFRPEPRILEDSSDDDDEESLLDLENRNERPTTAPEMEPPTRRSSPRNPARIGPRPTFWLDVLNPTEAEMKVLIRAFGIHPLTAEDIMMQEAREKVELFRSYYLVSYRTFEQDTNSENYLEPVNIYFVVFREGVLSVRAPFCTCVLVLNSSTTIRSFTPP